MTDFAVTGKKGAGKGLFSAGLIRDALLAGKRVATNMDIFVEHILPPTHKGTWIRLPDCPTVADLEMIGCGNDSMDEERNGIIVLDEASKYFNARAYGDKERQPLLDWLIHSRKFGWDVYYQMQGLSQVDKQIRETQIEYHIGVKRTDKWPIPFLTPLAKLIGINLRFPKMHVGVFRHGCDRDSLIVDRKWYRAKDLHNGYDTRQIFLDRWHPKACGTHTMLSAWHLKGRHLAFIPPKWLRFVFGLVGYDWVARASKPQRQRPPPKPKHPVAAILAKLPPDEALRHWRRLDELGAFNDATPYPVMRHVRLAQGLSPFEDIQCAQ